MNFDLPRLLQKDDIPCAVLLHDMDTVHPISNYELMLIRLCRSAEDIEFRSSSDYGKQYDIIWVGIR